MIPTLYVAPVLSAASPLFDAAHAIYVEAFGSEDRMLPDDFAACAGMDARRSGGYQGHFWVFGREQTADGTPKTEGMAIFGYNGMRNLAFLSYFAVDTTLRSSGIGAAALPLIVEQVTQDGLEINRKPPDGLWWEVHPADEANASATRLEQNRRRIAFYRNQGAQPLPLDYKIPLDIPDLPYVRYLILYLPIALPVERVGRRTLRKLVNAYRDEYDLPPDHPFVLDALTSIPANPLR